MTILLLFLCVSAYSLHAESYNSSSAANSEKSKRIEVYSLSQNYWDVQYGDTLGSIVHHLLPNNPAKREALQQDLLHLNPHAFVRGEPTGLLAGKRLWLPSYMKQADSKINPATTTV